MKENPMSKYNSVLLAMLIMISVIGGLASAVNAQDLNALKSGNRRFVRGLTNQTARQYPHQNKSRLTQNATGGQQPFVTVISCSDSRVPVELVFDAGLGDIFSIRIAGNVCDIDEAGSIEYGAGHLSTPLLVVMGHTGCGAVTAVVEGAEVHGSIPALVDNIIPAVDRARSRHPRARGKELVNYAVTENVWQGIDDLFKISEEIRHLVSSGSLDVQGAVYELETGEVKWLGQHPDQRSLLRYSGGTGTRGGH
ncbi:MAG: carbonic anhydrase [Candidatus Marinimicrobia bacterium]|nr:carbonic anhydrase [Candidatus Neomarinimicrobiota bacterium]